MLTGTALRGESLLRDRKEFRALTSSPFWAETPRPLCEVLVRTALWSMVITVLLLLKYFKHLLLSERRLSLALLTVTVPNNWLRYLFALFFNFKVNLTFPVSVHRKKGLSPMVLR